MKIHNGVRLGRVTFLIGIIGILFMLSGCSCERAERFVEDKPGIAYDVFHINGMPCIRVSRVSGSSVWAYDGVSCDWSKLKGEMK